MQKSLLVLLALVLFATSAVISTGCQRAPAAGKLQIMYSGNIRGNVSPCG
jgi:hypothetical protein